MPQHKAECEGWFFHVVLINFGQIPLPNDFATVEQCFRTCVTPRVNTDIIHTTVGRISEPQRTICGITNCMRNEG